MPLIVRAFPVLPGKEEDIRGIFYRYEDYTIDSFILQGLSSYLPGALLLNLEQGDYQANIFGLELKLAF